MTSATKGQTTVLSTAADLRSPSGSCVVIRFKKILVWKVRAHFAPVRISFLVSCDLPSHLESEVFCSAKH